MTEPPAKSAATMRTSPFCPDARDLVLPVLAEVAWADGHLSLPERSAARGAALALGLLHPLQSACGSLLPVDHAVQATTLAPLPLRDRQLLVGCAAWMALANGVETPAETAAVRGLADRASLSRASADLVIGAARWVRTVSPAQLTWRQELARLLASCTAALSPPPANRKGFR